MNVADGGGGRSAGSSIVYGHETLAGVSSKLTQAASAMDSLGRSMPESGDTGLAGPILNAMMAAMAQAGARLAVEADTIGALVSECNRTALDADRANAEALLARKASS